MTTQSTQSKIQSTVPTTIGQILSFDTVQFKIYDQPVHIIYVVGCIRRLRVIGYEISFGLEDHTGVIEAEMHLESQSEVDSKLPYIFENKYAKVFGKVRIVNDLKKLQVLKVIHVDDCNIISLHYLQVISFTLKAKEERKRQLASANTTGRALADSLSVMENDSIPVAPRLNDLQKLVFDIIKFEFTDIGIARNNVLRQFPAFQHTEIRQVMEHLIQEGFVYTSVDQEHLKAIE